MPFLMIQAVDNPMSGDPERDKFRYRAGDVLDVMPDDWTPGAGEKGNPNFKFVKVPGAVADYAHLKEDPTRTDFAKATERRARKVDLVAFEASVKTDKVDAKVGAISEVTAVELAKTVKLYDAKAEEIVKGGG